jgi:hypothetical protein
MFIVSSRCRRPPCKTPTESSGPCAGCGSIAGGSRLSASPSRASCWPTTSFRYDRDLLKDLCRVAHERLIEFLRTSLGLPEGVPVSSWPLTPSASIWISTPQLHALVADGLFAHSGVFHVMPKTDLKPLEELFRAK